MVRKSLLTFTIIAAISGCSSRPYATLVPVPATVPGAHTVDMMVATTRAPSPVRGVVYGAERGNALTASNIVVSIPPDSVRAPGDVIFPRSKPADPSKEFATLKITPMDERGATNWFHNIDNPNKRVLIFVHGFNTSYEEAVFRFAQLSHDAGAETAPVLFTWPSQGSIFGYLYDRDSANYSRSALEALIEQAAANPEVEEITLMAHSMGSWLTMEALRQYAIRKGDLPKKLQNIVLASPDLDVDVFRDQLDEIGTSQDRITIFTSQDDRALLVSRRLAGGTQRLGSVDLTNPEVMGDFSRRGIEIVDLSGIKGKDELNHSKFASTPAVVQAIGRRLIAGDRVSGAGPSLTETISATAIGTAQGVGSAIGATASIPQAIVDPNARENVTRQFKNARQNLSGSVLTVTGQ